MNHVTLMQIVKTLMVPSRAPARLAGLGMASLVKISMNVLPTHVAAMQTVRILMVHLVAPVK